MNIKNILKTTLGTLLISSSILATEKLPTSYKNTKLNSDMETMMKVNPKARQNNNNYGCVKAEWGMHEPIKSYGYTINFWRGESINFCFPESNDYKLSLIKYEQLGRSKSHALKLIDEAIKRYGEPKTTKKRIAGECRENGSNYSDVEVLELIWEDDSVIMEYFAIISTGDTCSSTIDINILDKKVLHSSYESDTGA